MIPKSATAADQVRELGISVGDTIEGTEYGDDWSHTARLTLLWVGETVAVWRYAGCDRDGAWSTQRECANWTLACRDWRKIEVSA